MNQLRPILRGNPTRAQRLVLSSAKLDEAPSHGKSRTLAALGLSGTFLATTQVAGAVTAASIGSTGAVTAAGSTISVGLATLKGLAIGVVASSVVYGSIVAVRDNEQHDARPSELQNTQQLAPSRGQLRQSEDLQRKSADAPMATRKTNAATLPVEEIGANDVRGAVQTTESRHALGASPESPALRKGLLAPSESPRPGVVAHKVNHSPGAQAGTTRRAPPGKAVADVPSPPTATAAPAPGAKDADRSPLASEITILDSAQRALHAGQPAVALQDLDTYRRLSPDPHLLPEATLVRIEALLALGQMAEARKLGEQLLVAQPTGALAQRVRSLLNPQTKP